MSVSICLSTIVAFDPSGSLRTGTPRDYLPGPISNDAIHQLFLSIGLPRPSSIVSAKVTAQYHSIYFITVPENEKTVHTKLVLRVSGKHLPKIKTENEAAVLTWVKQNTRIPVPDLVAYDSSDANVIGYEYNLVSLVEGGTLSDNYKALTDVHLERILDQLLDYLGQLHGHPWNAIGGLRINNDGTIVVDRIVDETFWQAPEVQRLWPKGETLDTLNISGPYSTYVDLIVGQIRTYIHLIQTHETLALMREAIPRLEAFVKVLPEHADELNHVKLRLAHKDLHFANILYDFESGRITSILDWEFSGVVPFTKWDPRRSFLWNGQDDEDSAAEKTRLLELFKDRIKKHAIPICEDAEYFSPLQESMQTVADFLRAITEVAPRAPRGQSIRLVEYWKGVVLDNIAQFGV